jgi:hypothetical protein
MADLLLRRIPVVGGLGYRERVQRLPAAFVVTLVPEPDNRYLPCAIAVVTDRQKVGYVAPEIARRYYEPLRARSAEGPVSCAGRRAARSDHETSGVELLLDFTELPFAPPE